jgi:hypothetical protein
MHLLPAHKTGFIVEKDTLLFSRREVFHEPRDVTRYLTRRLRGERVDSICRGFNISTYSSLNSAIETMRKEILTNGRSKRRMHKVEALLTSAHQEIGIS